jgi:hypothetical protein
MTREFSACKQDVYNRGKPPTSFLDELVEWGRIASPTIFAKNDLVDIYSSVRPQLGPWQGDLHRRAAMLEVLRVLGGFESSWNWKAGVDTTNPTSNTPQTEEAGIFQCSCNSMSFSPSLKSLLSSASGDTSCHSFISATKTNHRFALEYCARLIRFTIAHHGPIKGKHIHAWLQRDAVIELQGFLS